MKILSILLAIQVVASVILLIAVLDLGYETYKLSEIRKFGNNQERCYDLNDLNSCKYYCKHVKEILGTDPIIDCESISERV